MFKKYKWPLLCLIGIAIIGYCIFHHIRYSPRLNPHPKYFVTIKGTVSPQLQDKIRFYMGYGTDKRRCEQHGLEINYSYGRSKSIDIKPSFNKKNQYSITIPLDKYKLGWCGWNPYHLGYYFISKKYNQKIYDNFVLFSNNYVSEKNSLKFNCYSKKTLDKKSFIECASKNLFIDGGSLTKPRNTNYILNINFMGDMNASSY